MTTLDIVTQLLEIVCAMLAAPAFLGWVNQCRAWLQNRSAPSLLHYDMDLILRSIRDLFTADIQRVCVDSGRDYQRIVEFLETVMPRFTDRVEHYTDSEPIFDRFGVEAQLSKALEPKVWLK